MFHPVVASANAKVRYDDLLHAAETHRRVKKLQRSDRGLQTYILSRLGRALLALGARIQSRTDARVPVWNE